MKEIHPFGYFAPANAEKLIIGSFPCHNGKDYGDWFYSGSGKNDFWLLLSDIFKMPALTKEQKQKICIENKIAITDIAYSIERTKNDCKDANLKILEYNKSGIEKCLSFNINKIFFTSKFVEKHFKQTFSDIHLPSFILISPSPAANLYIAGLDEYKNMILNKEISSPYDFRLLNYQKLLL